jgi:hypothetical protein
MIASGGALDGWSFPPIDLLIGVALEDEFDSWAPPAAAAAPGAAGDHAVAGLRGGAVRDRRRRHAGGGPGARRAAGVDARRPVAWLLRGAADRDRDRGAGQPRRPRAGFYRIHRATLVRLSAIVELSSTADGTRVRLGDGKTELPVARERARALKTSSACDS